MFFAAKIIAADLHRIKKLVEITNEEPLDESAEDKTEDGMKLTAGIVILMDFSVLLANHDCM